MSLKTRNLSEATGRLECGLFGGSKGMSEKANPLTAIEGKEGQDQARRAKSIPPCLRVNTNGVHSVDWIARSEEKRT